MHINTKTSKQHYSILEENGRCRILRDGVIILESPAAHQPKRALELLKTINNLKDLNSRPIYSNSSTGEVHFWAMLQEHLFWEYLQPFIKYRDIIVWMLQNPDVELNCDIPGVNTWRNLIAKTNNSRISLSFNEWCRHMFEKVFLFCNALLCRLFSILSPPRFLLWSLNSVQKDHWIDFRLRDVYSVMDTDSISYLEGFAFPGFKPIAQRLFRRKQLAFYAPNVLRILPKAKLTCFHIEYDFHAVKGMPTALLRILVRQFELLMANARIQGTLLKYCLRIIGIRSIIGIDEHTTFAPLIAAAAKLHIETVGLQHGGFHKYSIGWTTPGIPHPFTNGYDKLLVWGRYWSDLLAKLSTTYTADRLYVSGFIRPSTLKLRGRLAQPRTDCFNILLPYEFLANPLEIADYIEAFAHRGYKVFFKVRFDDTLDQQLLMLPRGSLELVPELTQEILDSINVCAGTSTTMMYELYYLGVPVWFLGTEVDNNCHMVDSNLATLISLDALRDDDFDPYGKLIAPENVEYVISGEGIPQTIRRHLGDQGSQHFAIL